MLTAEGLQSSTQKTNTVHMFAATPQIYPSNESQQSHNVAQAKTTDKNIIDIYHMYRLTRVWGKQLK